MFAEYRETTGRMPVPRKMLAKYRKPWAGWLFRNSLFCRHRLIQRPQHAVGQELSKLRKLEIVGVAEGREKDAAAFVSVGPCDRLGLVLPRRGQEWLASVRKRQHAVEG